jgi:hypothetical protein
MHAGIVFTVLIFLLLLPFPLPGEEPAADEGKKEPTGLNISAAFLYGMYETLDTGISLAGDTENFSYQVDSRLFRSGDYDYPNSSFMTGEAGFAGLILAGSGWVISPGVRVEVNRNGLFDNTAYSDEESARVNMDLSAEYRKSPSSLELNLKAGYGSHGLAEVGGNTSLRHWMVNLSPSVIWQYVWSSANKVTLESDLLYRHFSDIPSGYDLNWRTRLRGTFKLFEYLILSLGPTLSTGRDELFFVGGDIRFSTSGLEVFTAETGYGYRLDIPDPVMFYGEEQYVLPEHDLPDSRRHHAWLTLDFDIPLKGESPWRFNRVDLGIETGFEDSTGYLALYTASDVDMISREMIPAMMLTLSPYVNLEVLMGGASLTLKLLYTYTRIWSERHIPYRPEHEGTAGLLFSSKYINVTWDNTLQYGVHTEPGSSDERPLTVRGDLEIHVPVAGGLGLTLRAWNLYNSPLVFREGYPEPGFRVTGGLKVVL